MSCRYAIDTVYLSLVFYIPYTFSDVLMLLVHFELFISKSNDTNSQFLFVVYSFYTKQLLRYNGYYLMTVQCLILHNSALLVVFCKFIPSCVFNSFNSFMYGDIAECGFAAAERSSPMKVDPLRHKAMSTVQYTGRVGRRAGLGGVMIGIGEQVYSILLLTIFFIGIFATGFVPYVGKAINFLLLSWIYAYYCFKYKWNHSEIDLDRRLNLFESNWAFFAGFGSSCVLPVLFFSPLVTYGIMAILFPLFVLTATDSKAEGVLSSQRTKWGDAELGRLPIVYAADTLSLRILSLLPFEPQQQQKDIKAR